VKREREEGIPSSKTRKVLASVCKKKIGSRKRGGGRGTTNQVGDEEKGRAVAVKMRSGGPEGRGGEDGRGSET